MPPLRLVEPPIDGPTVARLSELLEQAKRGEVVGIAYVTLGRGTEYSGDVVGRAANHPVFMLGAARALDHLVASATRK